MAGRNQTRNPIVLTGIVAFKLCFLGIVLCAGCWELQTIFPIMLLYLLAIFIHKWFSSSIKVGITHLCHTANTQCGWILKVGSLALCLWLSSLPAWPLHFVAGLLPSESSLTFQVARQWITQTRHFDVYRVWDSIANSGCFALCGLFFQSSCIPTFSQELALPLRPRFPCVGCWNAFTMNANVNCITFACHLVSR